MKSNVRIKLVLGILLGVLLPVTGTILTNAPFIWPCSTLFYSLGLVFGFAMVPGRWLRIIGYNFIAATFFVIDAAFFLSYYIQNAGFNDAFFYHLRPDLIHAGLRENLPVLLGMVACLFAFLCISSAGLTRERVRKRWVSPIAFALLLFGLFISPPARGLLAHVANLESVPEGNDLFKTFPELRRQKIAVKFSKSKRPNIVLIYGESLEERFFDEAVFPGLLPQLKRIRAQSLDFTNVAQGVGAGWTMGGMVASQCGYPLAGSHDLKHNELSIFDRFMPKATCLGDLLGQDGYHLTFIGAADARFAGKESFLRSHGFNEVLDHDKLLPILADKKYQNAWGVFDDSLFDFAIKKFRTLSSGGSPFLLSLLTIDTHGSVGYLSKSCGDYGAGENSMLNSVHCSDQLISEFIEKIRNSPYSENTIIVVLSDHLAMRNRATPLLESSRMPKRLTFFVNTPDGRAGENSNPGTHFDIAPTILELAGYNIAGQMGFGASLTRGPGFLPGRFGEDAWRKQAASLMAISSTLWDNEMAINRDGIKFTAANLVLQMGGRTFNLRSYGREDVPASTLFIFDATSLQLEKIKSYPFERGLTEDTLDSELLQRKEKLALVISRAAYLPGFCEPSNDPDQWVFFCGKPGGNFFSWGPVNGDFLIPFDLIEKLSRSEIDSRVVQARESILRTMGEKVSLHSSGN